MFGLLLVAVSTSNVNAVNCVAKPNGQPSRGQHWFYRTDHVTQRQCWYLARQDAEAQKSTNKKLSSARKPRDAHRPTAAAPQVPNIASAAETDIIPSPAAEVLADAAKLSDVPPSIAPAPQPALAESSSADATGPAPAPASNDIEELQSPINSGPSQVATVAPVAGEAPSSVLVVTLALLAMVGPLFHTVRWLRRRKASDQWGLGPTIPVTMLPCTSTPDLDSEIGARCIPPRQPLKHAEQKVALALRRLLNDTQTKSNVESFDQAGQVALELQQLLNEAQIKECASSQTEQLAYALNILRDRDNQCGERHQGQLTSATDAPLRSRDLLLANQRN